MVDFDNPETIILLPLAGLLALEVGLSIASARNEAAIPLIGECPSFIGGILFGNYNPEMVAASMECMVGIMLLLAIPGVVGVGKLVLDN